MRKILITIRNYLYLFIFPFSKEKFAIANDKLIVKSNKDNKSIIRFGDGEYRIMYKNKGIHYQDYNDSLKKELLDILKNYSNDSNYIICLPPFFFKNAFWFLFNDTKYIHCFSVPRFYWRKNINKHVKYGDAFFFGKGNDKIFSKLWENNDKIIFVHNDKKWCDLFNLNYSKNAIFIKSPKKNSYNKLDEIEKKIKKIDVNKNYLILVSSGPMAKILAYRLSLNNHHVIDTGHCFDDPLV